MQLWYKIPFLWDSREVCEGDTREGQGRKVKKKNWVETACFSTCFLRKQNTYSLDVLHLLHPLCTLQLEGIIIRSPVGSSAERDDSIWEQESWQDLCRELGSRCLASLSSPAR